MAAFAASLVAATTPYAQSQSTPANPPAPSIATSFASANTDHKADSASTSAAEPDRAQSYYHSALAHIYEEEAIASGRPEYMRHAVEEYKTALSADPNSPQLNDELADLYFRTGQVREAEATARGLLKTSPNDIEAHRLLGRLYLRQLSEAQNSVSSSSPTGNTLDLAIGEFQKIVTLDPKSVEDRMVLGQLYGVEGHERGSPSVKSLVAAEGEHKGRAVTRMEVTTAGPTGMDGASAKRNDSRRRHDGQILVGRATHAVVVRQRRRAVHALQETVRGFRVNAPTA